MTTTTAIAPRTIKRLKELIDQRMAIQCQTAARLSGEGLYRMSELASTERPFSPELARIKREAADIAEDLPSADAMLDCYHAMLEHHGSRAAGHLERLWDGVRGWRV